MKKLKKLANRKSKQVPERITNDTVSEHRKRILAGGRKFKYPLQYSRHTLIINTTIITAAALVVVALFGWWQLYPQQNTSQFAYRFTSVAPLPVARVDGEYVRYSDYLLKFRSAEHYLQQKEQAILGGEDGDRQRTYLKRQSLEDVIADTYAAKLARDRNITVSSEELSEFLRSARSMEGGEITERTHYAVIRDYYDWSPTEYEHIMQAKLLRQKVAFEVDGEARATIERLAQLAAGDSSWESIVQDYRNDSVEVLHGSSGMVPKTNQDGGMASAAIQLADNEVSDIILSTTGEGYSYSIVRLIDSNETHVNYEFLQVPLTEFQSQLNALYHDEKVQIYIDVPRPEEEEG